MPHLDELLEESPKLLGKESFGYEFAVKVAVTAAVSALAAIAANVWNSGQPVVIALAGLSASLACGCLFFYWRIEALHEVIARYKCPGYRGWLVNRKDDTFVESMIGKARRSIEVMGASGSSMFYQGGRVMDLLHSKFTSSTAFQLRVLLISPLADKLISYRIKRLGREPNVLSPEDILSTIRVLHKARRDLNLGPSQEIEIRTYTDELVWSIMLIDRQIALLGAYGPGMSGWKWPVLVFERSEPSSFYYAIEEQFDQRWHNAERVVEQILSS